MILTRLLKSFWSKHGNKILGIVTSILLFTIVAIVLSSLGIFCPPFGAAGAALFGALTGLVFGVLTLKLITAIQNCLKKKEEPKIIDKSGQVLERVKSGFLSTKTLITVKLFGNGNASVEQQQTKKLTIAEKDANTKKTLTPAGESFVLEPIDHFIEVRNTFCDKPLFPESEFAFLQGQLEIIMKQNISETQKNVLSKELIKAVKIVNDDERFEKLARICWVLALRSKTRNDKALDSTMSTWAVANYKGSYDKPTFTEIIQEKGQHVFAIAKHKDFLLADPSDLLSSIGIASYSAAKQVSRDVQQEEARHNDKSLHLDDDNPFKGYSNRSAYGSRY